MSKGTAAAGYATMAVGIAAVAGVAAIAVRRNRASAGYTELKGENIVVDSQMGTPLVA